MGSRMQADVEQTRHNDTHRRRGDTRNHGEHWRQLTTVKKYKANYTGNVMDGDVFIVKCDRKVQNAGVYSDGQIIQLKVLKGILWNSTEVNKLNVDTFTEGNRFAIYRKKGGIPRTFKENVDEAMSKRPETDYTYYNCMEFVMELLEIYLQPTASDCNKISSGAKPKGFKVVKKFSDDYNKHAKLGDLFLVQSGIFGYGYLHAGVCCSENGPEIIQFTGTATGFLLISNTVSPCSGTVNKVHVKTFSGGSKYAIYRSQKGIPNSFQEKIDKAMSSRPEYNLKKYNCVHFALELLFGKLKKKERDVESLNKRLFDEAE